MAEDGRRFREKAIRIDVTAISMSDLKVRTLTKGNAL